MEELRKQIKRIIGSKMMYSSNLNPDSVLHSVMETEIADATYMLILINSNENEEHIRTAIKVIANNTTSSSLHEAVINYLNKDGNDED